MTSEPSLEMRVFALEQKMEKMEGHMIRMEGLMNRMVQELSGLKDAQKSSSRDVKRQRKSSVVSGKFFFSNRCVSFSNNCPT